VSKLRGGEVSRYPNQIMVSQLTGQWYLVLAWNKDGSAKKKIDITSEMAKVKKQMQFEWELLENNRNE
jgi:hypothetical protein